jgi:hypothetical protein
MNHFQKKRDEISDVLESYGNSKSEMEWSKNYSHINPTVNGREHDKHRIIIYQDKE